MMQSTKHLAREWRTLHRVRERAPYGWLAPPLNTLATYGAAVKTFRSEGRPDLVRTDQESRRGRGPVAGRVDQGATAPRIAIDEALRDNRLEMWYQPKIDIKANASPAPRRSRASAIPRKACCCREIFLPSGDERRPRPSMRCCTLRDWTVFDEAGFNLRLAINVPVNICSKLPIPQIVAENRPGRVLAGPDRRGDRGPDRARHRCARRSPPIAGQRHLGRDRRFRRRLFVVLQPARAPVRRAQARPQLRQGLRQRSDQCGDLPDRDRSRPSLRQRRGRQGIETIADLQAMQIMGCDFGQGHLIAPPMPKEGFHGAVAAAHEQAARRPAEPPTRRRGRAGRRGAAACGACLQRGARRPDGPRRNPGPLSRLRRYARACAEFTSNSLSANGRAAPSGSGTLNTSSIIATRP